MISTKSEFMKLWDAGKLGNKLQTWNSIEDTDYNGPFSIRSRRPDSRNTMYGVARSEVPDVIDRLVRLGERSSDLYFGEMAPDQRLTIQGEYLDGMLAGFTLGDPPEQVSHVVDRADPDETGQGLVTQRRVRLVGDPPRPT